jgi:hypothetical protein
MNSVELLIARLDAKRKQRPLSAGEEQIRQEALWVLGTLQRAATSPHKGRGPTQRSQEQKQLFVQDSDDEASSGSDEEAMRMADESMRNAAVTDTLSGGSSDEDELFEHVFEDLSPEVRELEQKLSARMKHGRKAAAPAAQDTSDGKQTFLFNNSSAEQSWLHDLSQPKDDVPAKFNRFKYSQPDLP